MTKKLGQKDAQEKDDLTSKRQDPPSQLRGIRVQGELGNSTYHSIVYGHEQTKVFTFPYIEWAHEGLAEMLPLKNWDAQSPLNGAEAAALEKIVRGFQERLDRFIRVLRETIAINPNPGFPDDGIALVTCKIAWVGGQQKLSVCKEVAPGLGTLPGIALGQEVWPLIHLSTGKFVLRSPSYEMACKAADYVTSFMDFRSREAFVQFQGSNFPGILQ